MMRGLNQNIPGIGERKQAARSQAPDKIRNHMDVCPGHQTQRNALLIDYLLKLEGRGSYLRTGVVIKAGKNMRGAGQHGHALRDRLAGYFQRDRGIRRPVVDSWQYMAVKVNHLGNLLAESSDFEVRLLLNAKFPPRVVADLSQRLVKSVAVSFKQKSVYIMVYDDIMGPSMMNLRLSIGVATVYAFATIAAQAATLDPITGTVSEREGSGGGFHQVRSTTEVHTGDTVMTGPNGSARIVLDDGCVIKVEPGQVVTVPQAGCRAIVGESSNGYLIAAGAGAAAAIAVGIYFATQQNGNPPLSPASP